MKTNIVVENKNTEFKPITVKIEFTIETYEELLEFTSENIDSSVYDMNNNEVRSASYLIEEVIKALKEHVTIKN